MQRARLMIACMLALGGAATVLAQQSAPQGQGRHEVDGRKSGYLFLSAETRALQDDDFQNPGMFAVERGRELFARANGGPACASCHADDLKGVAAHYPKYEAARGGLVNLELKINDERGKRQKLAPLAHESEDMLALAAFLTFQSRGVPMQVDVTGPAAAAFEQGRAFYFQRRGQLDLACSQCHDALVGTKLRGDVISQGQVNGFPIYRLGWRAMASRHRLFEWCNTSVRAEPFANGSQEYLALELYVAWRGRGLALEAPGVRR